MRSALGMRATVLAISGAFPQLKTTEKMGILGARRDFESEIRPELPVLYRVARRMVRCEDEAEDLVGQTVAKAYAAWSRFDGQYLRSWLIKILRNEVYNVRRMQESRPEESELRDDLAGDGPFWDDVHWKICAQHLHRELDKLPDEFRLAVHLCDIEGMSYEEAACAMDVPVGTVRSRLFRGRARLRTKLSAYVEETLEI